jgi:hypothetical protein
MGSEFRQREPERHLAIEHASLDLTVTGAAAFTRDDEDKPCTIPPGAAQKRKERGISFSLRPAVQVEPTIDRLGASREPLLLAPIEALDRRLRFRQWCCALHGLGHDSARMRRCGRDSHSRRFW